MRALTARPVGETLEEVSFYVALDASWSNTAIETVRKRIGLPINGAVITSKQFS